MIPQGLPLRRETGSCRERRSLSLLGTPPVGGAPAQPSHFLRSLLGEALALLPKDLDPRAGTVAVLHGKGDKRRTIGLDPGAFALVDRWLDRRRELGVDGRQPVLCTLGGAPLKDAYVRALLRRLALKVGIEKRVHAHGLRHSHAAELAAEGFPTNLVQAQLGHSSLATTDRYLRHIAPQQLIDAVRRRAWDV